MAGNHFGLYLSGVIFSFGATSSLLHLALFNPWFWGCLALYAVGLGVATQLLKLPCGVAPTRVLLLSMIGGFIFAVIGFIPSLF